MKSAYPIGSRTSVHHFSQSWFGKMANATSTWTGRPTAFMFALGTVIIWGITGPFFHYSDTWQLVINTGTTIITFLMVFLIQNTQNRDTLALQVKLSELIIALEKADNRFAAIDDEPDEELEQAHEELKTAAKAKGTDVSRPRGENAGRSGPISQKKG